MKFFENEFDGVGGYLEFLSKGGLCRSKRDNDTIDKYINECKKYAISKRHNILKI